MMASLHELSDQYVTALQNYLRGGAEASLRQAYELGRVALMDGLGVLEITVLYHQALANALRHTLSPTENARVVQAGETFFLESLAPFEMTHRGFRETNVLLQDSDERYRELFENATDIVFFTDPYGNIISINPAGEQAIGYHSGETPPVSLVQMVAPEYLHLAKELLSRGNDGNESRNSELEIVTKDGRRVPVEVSSRPVVRDGQFVGVQGIARDITERKLAQQALLRLNDASEEEARRIAHALHDEAGQLLASVHLALEEVASDPQVGKRILPVKDVLFAIEEQLRRLSHELRPTILDDLGIRPALEFLTEGVAQRTGLEIHLDFSLNGRLSPQVETILYRITQEALNNINKHAQAKHVWIQVSANGEVQCLIRDDGVGFDVGAVYHRKGRLGLGLRGVQERLAAVGGHLVISSAKDNGTSLLATIPKAQNEAKGTHGN